MSYVIGQFESFMRIYIIFTVRIWQEIGGGNQDFVSLFLFFLNEQLPKACDDQFSKERSFVSGIWLTPAKEIYTRVR